MCATLRERVARCAILVALAVASPLRVHAETTAAPAPASATDDPEALFQRARALHGDKKWPEALEAYRRAWQREESVRVATNLALVELKLDEPRDAAEHLSFALAHLPPDDPKTPEVRARLEGMLAEAKGRVGTVHLEVREEGADVFLDGVAVGKTPLGGALFVAPGRHVVRVEQVGMQPVSLELAVGAAEVAPLQVSLIPVASEPPPATPVPTRREAPVPADDGGVEPQVFVALGGAALTLGAAGLGVFFLSKQSSEDDRAGRIGSEIDAETDPNDRESASACAADPPHSRCTELSAAVSGAAAAGDNAAISFVTAGALGVATVVTTLLWPSPEPGARQSPGGGVRVSASIAPEAQGLLLHGTF